MSAPHPTKSRKRWAFAVSTLILVLAGLVVLLAGGAWFLRSGAPALMTTDQFVVRRGTFEITIPASGELAAMRSIEIASELEGRAVITEIALEGTRVAAGDVLIRLDDKTTRDAVSDGEDSVQLATAALVSAQSNLSIKEGAHASEIEAQDVTIRLAELGLESWEKGQHVSQLKALELDVETSRKDFDRLVERYEASVELNNQEFLSRDELQLDEIKMIQAKSKLEQAEIALQVYNDFEIEKSRAELESALQQARDKRIELVQKHENEIQSLEAELESKSHQLESKQRRLDELREQLTKCVITAPQDGLVVYVSSLDSGRGGRGRDENPPEVGTELSRNRPVIILPDISEMAAEVKVNEALSGRIDAKQAVLVESDALPGIVMHGEVVNVSVLAESGGWRDPNRRDYRVKIRLHDAHLYDLKPSMRCKAEIQVGRRQDVLYVPVSAVFYEGDKAVAYVPDGAGYAQRVVELGSRSELYVEIIDGLEEGESVLLRQPGIEEITRRVERSTPGRTAAPARTGKPETTAPSGDDGRPRDGGGRRPAPDGPSGGDAD